MIRVSSTGTADRIGLPTSPAIFLRGIVRASSSDSSTLLPAVLTEEKSNPAGGASLPPYQDL